MSIQWNENFYPAIYGLWAAGWGINFEHTMAIFTGTERARTYVQLGDAEGLRECIQNYCVSHGLHEAYNALNDSGERLLWMQIVQQANEQR